MLSYANTICHDITKKISIKNYEWQIKPYDERLCTAIQQRMMLPEIIARLLSSKGVSLEQVPSYINPLLREYLPDPYHLNDMDKAVDRIISALERNEKIVIFGDYDVDGATSSALLKRLFAMIGASADIYIPDRIEEGYGPNIMAFKQLKAAGTNLIITVDCGTCAFEALEAATEMNLDVIVVDHHLGAASLPPARAIINPNRLDEKSCYRYLAAVGVAFLLAVGLVSCLRKHGWFNHRPEPNLLELLDLVALGTVCDVVPLEGVNRAFVNQGLKVLAKRTNLGLSLLSDIAKIDNFPNTYHLGFLLGPRINAGGRVGKADLGATLLSTYDYNLAHNIAMQLDRYNNERKAIEALVLEEAMLQAMNSPIDDPVIFVQGEGWHPGVIGIVAGRIKERYNKPVAVIAINDGIGKASCRSVTGIDFGSSITCAKELGIVQEGGGHAMAAGFTIDAKKIPELLEFLTANFNRQLSGFTGGNIRYFDSYLSCNGISLELAKNLEKVGPFGAGNPEPKFLINDSYLIKADIVGGSHISCIVSEGKGGKSIKATAFKSVETELGKALLGPSGRKFDLIGFLRINRWQGRENAELNIDDLIMV